MSLIGLLASVALVWKLLGHMHPRPNWYWPRVKQVLRFSVFSWFSDLGSALFSQADRILVGIYLGPALAGQYAVCTSVASKITQSAGALSHVLAPTASALQATQDRERVMRILRRGTRLLAVTVLCIGALAFYWSEIGLRVWLGQEFADQNTLPLRLIIVAYALFSLNATGFYVANGLGLPHVSASGAVAGALTTLLLISIIVPHLGLVGAAIGNFGYIASLGIFGFVVRYLRHSVQVEVWASFGAPMLVFLSAVAAMLLIGTDGLKPVVLSAITIMAFLGLTVCSERTAVRKIVTQGFSRWTIAQ